MPPQLVRVLEQFAFSDDREKALTFFSGPKLIYPCTCEEVIAVLETFSMSEDKLAVLRHMSE